MDPEEQSVENVSEDSREPQTQPNRLRHIHERAQVLCRKSTNGSLIVFALLTIPIESLPAWSHIVNQFSCDSTHEASHLFYAFHLCHPCI